MDMNGAHYLTAAFGGWLLASGLGATLREDGAPSHRWRIGSVRLPIWLVLAAGVALVGFAVLPSPVAFGAGPPFP